MYLAAILLKRNIVVNAMARMYSFIECILLCITFITSHYIHLITFIPFSHSIHSFIHSLINFKIHCKSQFFQQPIDRSDLFYTSHYNKTEFHY